MANYTDTVHVKKEDPPTRHNTVRSTIDMARNG